MRLLRALWKTYEDALKTILILIVWGLPTLLFILLIDRFPIIAVIPFIFLMGFCLFSLIKWFIKSIKELIINYKEMK